MLFPPVAQISRALHKFGMCRVHFDWNEFLRPSPRYLTSDVRELLDLLIPEPEYLLCLAKQSIKSVVWRIGKAVGSEDTEKLIIEIFGDGFDEGEGSSNWIGRQFEFAVDVIEDGQQGFLDLVKIRRREEIVQREVFHELIVFMDDVSRLLQPSVGHE